MGSFTQKVEKRRGKEGNKGKGNGGKGKGGPVKGGKGRRKRPTEISSFTEMGKKRKN